MHICARPGRFHSLAIQHEIVARARRDRAATGRWKLPGLRTLLASKRRSTVRRLGLWLAVVSSLLTGCHRSEELDVTYGRRKGVGAESVNGTSVLGEMFAQAGFTVSSWRRLSPRLDREQVLVWAPDRYAPPQAAEINFLETWLQDSPGRTLIYIGRGYDAGGDYWQEILPRLTSGERIVARQRLAQQQVEMARRAVQAAQATCSWFTLDPEARVVRPTQFTGPWSEAVTADEMRLSFHDKLTIPQGDDESEWESSYATEELLVADGRLVAGKLTRASWPDSQLIVIANGSWLLNYPLVNTGHQQLAARLIEECGPPDRVCFLESGEAWLTIADTDANVPLLLQVFRVYPLNVVTLHVVCLGILYCCRVLPIFGRPRQLPDENVADFGKHVTAVGELLARAHDVASAQEQVRQYREVVQGKVER